MGGSGGVRLLVNRVGGGGGFEAAERSVQEQGGQEEKGQKEEEVARNRIPHELRAN